jgi:TPR repeat protein
MRIKGSNRKLKAFNFLFASLLFWPLTACEDFKYSLRGADQGLQGFFGTTEQNAPQGVATPAPTSQVALMVPPVTELPSQPEPEPESPGDRAYREALEARAAGEDATAADRFEAAADLGHAAAAYELGLAYQNGKGRPIDLASAAKWVGLAADRGDARALYLVGVSYALGEGVEQDDEAATAYFGEAAVRGHSYAQYLLAEAFANGRGVEQDPDWAMIWYGKAARQGHNDAQFAYGALLGTGTGLPKDEAMAYSWFILAEKAGHPQASQLREALALRLDNDDRERAEAWAAAFQPRKSARFADRPTVMYLQYQLNNFGYDAGPVDGLFGPQTRAALIAFENEQGLAGTGQLTPDALDQILEASRSAA